MEELLLSAIELHGANNIREAEIHSSQPLVPEPSPVETEIAVGKLKGYKSPGIDQIPAELTQAGEILCLQIHTLTRSLCNKKDLLQQWNDSVIAPIYKNGDKTE
jgi:hypothetical protein